MNRSNHQAFTLIEVLLVISLLAIISSLSVFAGNDSYQRALAANDIERIVSVLYRARSLAQGSVCSIQPCEEPKLQGVRIEQGEVWLFEGSQYEEDTVVETFLLSDGLTVTPMTVFFLPHTGAATANKTIKIRDAFGRERSIVVSEAGVISVN
ncbi:MAG TPA: prepilin-type N-terminal cleavage/methylation domain-containing protein [Candidatus Paceibacterota bacterium]